VEACETDQIKTERESVALFDEAFFSELLSDAHAISEKVFSEGSSCQSRAGHFQSRIKVNRLLP
jgi:hypothetical protein